MARIDEMSKRGVPRKEVLLAAYRGLEKAADALDLVRSDAEE